MNKKRFNEELESMFAYEDKLDNQEFCFIAGVICIMTALACVAVWVFA